MHKYSIEGQLILPDLLVYVLQSVQLDLLALDLFVKLAHQDLVFRAHLSLLLSNSCLTLHYLSLNPPVVSLNLRYLFLNLCHLLLKLALLLISHSGKD